MDASNEHEKFCFSCQIVMNLYLNSWMSACAGYRYDELDYLFVVLNSIEVPIK